MQLAIDSRVFVFHDDNERKTRWWNARFPPQVIAQISPRILTRLGDFLSRRIEIHRRATHSGERKLATDTNHGQKQHLKQRNPSLWIQAERNKKLTLTILHAFWRLRISFPSRRRELLSLGSGDVLFKIFINTCKLSILIIVLRDLDFSAGCITCTYEFGIFCCVKLTMPLTEAKYKNHDAKCMGQKRRVVAWVKVARWIPSKIWIFNNVCLNRLVSP